MSKLTRDGTAEPVSRDQILRRERGQRKIDFPCSATDHVLRKASVARVNRRLRRYYLIVRLLPNVFVLACLSSGSI